VKSKDAEVLVQRRTDAKNAMWQKERLLNVALAYLPGHCTKVKRRSSLSRKNSVVWPKTKPLLV
jgi:hypothetical protein